MRNLTFKGKTTYLEEKDWRGMVRRWKKATEVPIGEQVKLRCPLCVKFKSCEPCPLNVFAFARMTFGCVRLVNAYLYEHKSDAGSLSYGDDMIVAKTEEGLCAARLIYGRLAALPRVPFFKVWWWSFLRWFKSIGGKEEVGSG